LRTKDKTIQTNNIVLFRRKKKQLENSTPSIRAVLQWCQKWGRILPRDKVPNFQKNRETVKNSSGTFNKFSKKSKSLNKNSKPKTFDKPQNFLNKKKIKNTKIQ
jgi:hypothetical protein